MYKKYYSPFEEQPIKKEYAAEVIQPQKLNIKTEDTKIKEAKKSPKSSFFGNISTEDIILIGILILLLTEDKESRDIPLILGIGFLLLIEYIENE